VTPQQKKPSPDKSGLGLAYRTFWRSLKYYSPGYGSKTYLPGAAYKGGNLRDPSCFGASTNCPERAWNHFAQ
jgi:hypothetical protein